MQRRLQPFADERKRMASSQWRGLNRLKSQPTFGEFANGRDAQQIVQAIWVADSDQATALLDEPNEACPFLGGEMPSSRHQAQRGSVGMKGLRRGKSEGDARMGEDFKGISVGRRLAHYQCQHRRFPSLSVCCALVKRRNVAGRILRRVSGREVKREDVGEVALDKRPNMLEWLLATTENGSE
jgi:hypothetical protein